MATKVYISGSFSELEVLRQVENRLAGLGYESTTSWLHEPTVNASDPDWLRRARANEDVEDIKRADVFLMSDEAETHNGGRHTELGVAIAERKSINIVGPRGNTFMYLNMVVAWHSFEDLFAMLESKGATGALDKD